MNRKMLSDIYISENTELGSFSITERADKKEIGIHSKHCPSAEQYCEIYGERYNLVLIQE